MKKILVSSFCIAAFVYSKAQKVAPLWEDFVQAKKTGKTSVLPDFSYAGYHWSEKEIPSVAAKKQFRVTDFGAKPNDDVFDDEAIQKTILAAEANAGGGVVFFPAGKYLIAPDTNNKKTIRISKSNIVLKGAGSSAGGTEIYQATMRIKLAGQCQITYASRSSGENRIGSIS